MREISAKVGLSLGGGGALGYAHIGVIRALNEASIPIDMINGSSMGAVIGGAYALYANIERVAALVDEVSRTVDIKSSAVFREWREDQSFLRGWFVEAVCDAAVVRGALLSHKNNIKALKMAFGEREFRDTEIPFSCVAVDLMTGEIITVKEGKLVDGILPSIAIPALYPPVEREGRLLVDGGVLAAVPVRELRSQGPDFIIAVKLASKIAPHHETGFDIITLIEKMKEDSIAQWELDDADFQITIQVSQMDIMSFDSYKAIISRGYETAVQALPELKRRLASSHV